MGSRDSASSSSSSSSNNNSSSGRGSDGRAGSSDAPCHGAAGPLSISSMFPRLGEVPFFDLMTSPRDRTGVKASFLRFVLELTCNGTRRRRRAERLSRLPMGVVPDAGAEVLASAPSKGGKHPAVDTFRGVDPDRPERLVPLVSDPGGPCHAPQTKKKADVLSERVQKFSARAKSGAFPFNINNNNHHQPPDQSLLKALVPERESETM